MQVLYNLRISCFAEKPFTLLAPKNKELETTETLLLNSEKVKKMLLNHIVLGQKLRLDDISGAFHFQTLGGKTVSVQEINGLICQNFLKIL